MRKLLLALVCAAMTLSVSAQKKKAPKIDFVDATQLTMVGKLCETTNPYHRVEVEKYPEFNKTEANLLKMASGLAIAFSTNATTIYVKAHYGDVVRWSQYAPVATTCGFNLFIRNDEGEWTWAASKAHKTIPNAKNKERTSKPLPVISGLSKEMKECLIYLPLYSELEGLEIGVNKGATIEAIPVPFRHKIAVFGSSFTHGSCASGAGLTWPAFLSRSIGMQLCSFGMSGNSKLQPIIGQILGETKADAYICDAFSNPSVTQIGARIRPFIEAIRKSNPNAPIIFLNTIYRESRNFIARNEKKEQSRIDYVENIMAAVVKEYKGVYFVNVPNQTGTDHVTSADGTHPYSYGYHRWAQAIEKPILKILKKHKIK